MCCVETQLEKSRTIKMKQDQLTVIKLTDLKI